MGPKEPGDPYTGCGEAAGAPRHPGNLKFCWIVYMILPIKYSNFNVMLNQMQ